jgi:hypothetical protein
MKKSALIIAIILSIFEAIHAQCVITTGSVNFLSPNPDSLPCVKRNVAYDETIQIYVQPTYSAGGVLTLNIEWVDIDDIQGLPSGINYVINPSNGNITGGNRGCIGLSGTTTAPAGNYPLNFIGNVYLTGAPFPPVFDGDTIIPISALASGGFSYYVDVIEPTATCRGVNPCTPINITATITNASSAGVANGAISTSVSGGQPPYTYSWSNSSTTQNLANVYAGNYTVTVTDVNNCTAVNTFTVGISPPSGCVPGASALPNGFYPGSSQLPCIARGEYYSQTIVFSCQSITPVDSMRIDSIINLPAGLNWSVAVPQGNGVNMIKNGQQVCITISGITQAAVGNYNIDFYVLLMAAAIGQVNASLEQSHTAFATFANFPPYTLQICQGNCSSFPSVTGTVTNATGAGIPNGSIDITVSGGTPPYTYSWTRTGTLSVINTEDVSAAVSATYTVVVTDNNGCQASETFDVGVSPDCSNAPDIAVTITHESRIGSNNGSINIDVTGGLPPYTYAWSGPATTSVISIDQDISSLPTGSYTVTVSDNRGCSITETFFVGVASGINDIYSNSITIYPNPAFGDYIIIQSEKFPVKQISIITLEGKEIINTYSKTVIDISQLKPSLYFCKIHLQNNHIIFKKLFIN